MDQDSHDGRATPATQQLLELIHGSWKSQAVCVAARLRLADLLSAGPKTSDELAAATGTHPPSLHRLLRALATIDICREREDGSFEITPMGALLGRDAPQSLAAWSLWWGEQLWPVWERLLYSVQTGKSARSLLTGMEGFDHLKCNPQRAELFNRALAELTRLEADDVLRAYDFSGLRTIIDVGGGYGEMLARILTADPKTRGVLFDLPHAIDGAKGHFQQAGLADRCDCVAGDFFQAIPRGGDAHILKNVLHDWDDEQAGRILGNCREAMGSGARLLVIERVLPDRMTTSPEHQSSARADLNMLVALAARERTETQFRALLSASGFRIVRIVPAGATHSVIEAVVA